jgi:hypothetical protein
MPRQIKWGEKIASANAHIAYLEQVQARFPNRPNFRGEELAQAREYAAHLRAEMVRTGKRPSHSFYGLAAQVRS